MELVPWAVGGGAEHSPEIARLLAHAAVGGDQGVIEPGGMKVVPLNVPGAGFRVQTGAVAVANAYPGGGQQTYILRNPVEETVTTTGTTSSGGRSDVVLARVVDPQYEGSTPADPNDFQYARIQVLQGVPSTTTSTDGLGLSYPCYALARIDYPSSTSTITSGMITDLRKLVQPRESSEVLVRRFNNVSPVTNTGPDYADWLGYAPSVYIPKWANTGTVIVTLSSLVRGDTSGWVNVTLGGTLVSDGMGYNYAQDSNSNADAIRDTMSFVGKWSIPSNMRGKTHQLRLRALRDAGKTGRIELSRTLVGFDCRWAETAV